MAETGMTIGLIKALAPKPDAATIEGAVADWLDDHPDATTTVQDGAITYAKLNSDLQGKVDDVDELKSAMSDINTATSGDVNKALSPKIVTNGKVTEWQFKPISGGGGSFDGTIVLEANQESVTVGSELASAEGWTLGTGWSGDLANGFTHTSGTDALEFVISGNQSGKMYVVQFTSTVDATTDNIFVTIGDSSSFPLFGLPQPYTIGIMSAGSGTLKFIPATGFTGTLSGISIKEVTGIVYPYINVEDTDSNTTIEYRSADADRKNIYIGLNAGQYDACGFGNVVLGDNAMKQNLGGFWNTALGLEALRDNTSGSRNIGIGYGALQKNDSGHRNIAIGTFALIKNTTGYENVAIGADALDECTQGYNNVANGFQALYKLTTGHDNVAIGKSAGQKLTTGSNNMVVGSNSLPSCETGDYNIAIGASVMSSTTASNNVAIGFGALYRNTNGANNVAIGTNAGKGSNAASQAKNVFIGASAGDNVYNSVNENVLIGYKAGTTLKSGSNNVCIGNGADVPANTTSNYLSINNHITGSKTSGVEWTQVLGDLIVKGTDGVRRQIVFNNDNTISWQTVS